MPVVVEIKDLEKYYQRGTERVHALRKVSLEINTGEFVAITGPSGSGKTTLLQIMGCLDHPSAGIVKIDGLSITELSRAEIDTLRRQKIGFVFQQFQLISSLSVKENVLLPLLFGRNKIDSGYFKQTLKIVGMEHREDHLPHQLSGGEMQRVAIARALINRPRMILADEPTGNLDTENSDRIFNLLSDLNKEGVTVIFVTHNPELSAKAGKQISFRDGTNREIGHSS
jgi:putative ABC transport system ATP-binding protein